MEEHKRSWSVDRTVPRPLIVIIAPICVALGFVTVLTRDIGRAFYAAWLEAKIEADSARRAWRGDL